MPNGTSERNVATVQRFYQAERERDLPGWVSLWNPAGRQTFPTLGNDAVVSGIAALEAVTEDKFATRPPYGIAPRVEGFADPSKVFAAVDLTFPDQPVVTIWCIFHFDAAGLVIEVEEIFDRGSALLAREA